MKKRINRSLIIKICLIIILIIIVIFGLTKYLNRVKKDDLNELYTYLGENDLDYCNGLSKYSKDDINYDSLANSERICNVTAMLYLKENYENITLENDNNKDSCSLTSDIVFALDDNTCNIKKIKKEDIDNQYLKVYGRKLEQDEEFTLNKRLVCYPNEDYYYCGKALSYTVTVGEVPKTYRSIKKTVKKKDQIIIYDYFLKTVNDICYSNYDALEEIDCPKEEIDYRYLKKYGTLYQHTFQKDGNNYYWVSSKKLK